MATLPPGWDFDYDGSRWFYRYKTTGVIQYHFPTEGDEFPSYVDAKSPAPVLAPEELLESQQQIRRHTSQTGTSSGGNKRNSMRERQPKMSATAMPVDDVWRQDEGSERYRARGRPRTGKGVGDHQRSENDEDENDDDDDDDWRVAFQAQGLNFLGPRGFHDVSPLAEEEDGTGARKKEAASNATVSMSVSPQASEKTTPVPAKSELQATSPRGGDAVGRVHPTGADAQPASPAGPKDRSPIQELPIMPVSPPEAESAKLASQMDATAAAEEKQEDEADGPQMLDSWERPHELPVSEASHGRRTYLDPVGVLAEMATEHTAPSRAETHPDPVELADNTILSAAEIMPPGGIAELPGRSSGDEVKREPAKDDATNDRQRRKSGGDGDAGEDIRRSETEPQRQQQPPTGPDRIRTYQPGVKPAEPAGRPPSQEFPSSQSPDAKPTQKSAKPHYNASLHMSSTKDSSQVDASTIPPILRPAMGREPSQSGQPVSPIQDDEKTRPFPTTGQNFWTPVQGLHPLSLTPAGPQQHEQQEQYIGARDAVVPQSHEFGSAYDRRHFERQPQGPPEQVRTAAPAPLPSQQQQLPYPMSPVMKTGVPQRKPLASSASSSSQQPQRRESMPVSPASATSEQQRWPQQESQGSNNSPIPSSLDPFRRASSATSNVNAGATFTPSPPSQTPGSMGPSPTPPSNRQDDSVDVASQHEAKQAGSYFPEQRRSNAASPKQSEGVGSLRRPVANSQMTLRRRSLPEQQLETLMQGAHAPSETGPSHARNGDVESDEAPRQGLQRSQTFHSTSSLERDSDEASGWGSESSSPIAMPAMPDPVMSHVLHRIEEGEEVEEPKVRTHQYSQPQQAQQHPQQYMQHPVRENAAVRDPSWNPRPAAPEQRSDWRQHPGQGQPFPPDGSKQPLPPGQPSMTAQQSGERGTEVLVQNSRPTSGGPGFHTQQPPQNRPVADGRGVNAGPVPIQSQGPPHGGPPTHARIPSSGSQMPPYGQMPPQGQRPPQAHMSGPGPLHPQSQQTLPRQMHPPNNMPPPGPAQTPPQGPMMPRGPGAHNGMPQHTPPHGWNPNHPPPNPQLVIPRGMSPAGVPPSPSTPSGKDKEKKWSKWFKGSKPSSTSSPVMPPQQNPYMAQGELQRLPMHQQQQQYQSQQNGPPPPNWYGGQFAPAVWQPGQPSSGNSQPVQRAPSNTVPPSQGPSEQIRRHSEQMAPLHVQPIPQGYYVNQPPTQPRTS